MFATWRLRQRSAVGGMGLNGHITPRKTLTPHVRFGSKREAAYFGLMSASASFGHNAAQTYGRVMPQERTNALRNRIATRSVSGNNPGSQAFPGGAKRCREQMRQTNHADAPSGSEVTVLALMSASAGSGQPGAWAYGLLASICSDKIRCSSSISAPGAVTFGLWLASSSYTRQPSALARAAN